MSVRTSQYEVDIGWRSSDSHILENKQPWLLPSTKSHTGEKLLEMKSKLNRAGKTKQKEREAPDKSGIGKNEPENLKKQTSIDLTLYKNNKTGSSVKAKNQLNQAS